MKKRWISKVVSVVGIAAIIISSNIMAARAVNYRKQTVVNRQKAPSQALNKVSGFRFLRHNKTVRKGKSFNVLLWYRFTGNNYIDIKISNKKVVKMDEISYEDAENHNRRACLYLTAYKRGRAVVTAKCSGKRTKCRIFVK